MKEKNLDAVEMQNTHIHKVQTCVAVQYMRLNSNKKKLYSTNTKPTAN
jgi:6-phosphogluconolactonase (cycloisomerase 2 family)